MFLTGQNIEKKLTLDSLQDQNYQLLGLVVAEPLKVAEHSFGSLWVYVICQIKATWSIEYNLWLARHHVQYSPRIDTKNHVALPLARLDLSQSAKDWYDFTTQY